MDDVLMPLALAIATTFVAYEGLAALSALVRDWRLGARRSRRSSSRAHDPGWA